MSSFFNPQLRSSLITLIHMDYRIYGPYVASLRRPTQWQHKEPSHSRRLNHISQYSSPLCPRSFSSDHIMAQPHKILQQHT